jgi:hypothetical protein
MRIVNLPGSRQKRTNTDRLAQLTAAVLRDWYASEAIPERDPSFRLPVDSPMTVDHDGVS